MPTTLHTGSTGRDVTRAQELLNLAGTRPRLTPDGQFGPATDRAVRWFQNGHQLTPDGIIGPQTWRALDRSARVESRVNPSGQSTNPQQPSGPAAHTGPGEFIFPFTFRPSPGWHDGGRNFGASRDNGTRLHAGCDLRAPRGTPIHAISDGVLVRNEYYFYSNTYAVEIRHGRYLVRYGEILGGSYCDKREVKKGEVIARVGLLSSGSSMLHFEMYSNGASSASLSGGGPYRRRSDLMNPTALLDQWAAALPR